MKGLLLFCFLFFYNISFAIISKEIRVKNGFNSENKFASYPTLSKIQNIDNQYFNPQNSIIEKSVFWKKVFRPIYIFDKKIRHWITIFGTITLFLSTFLYYSNVYNENPTIQVDNPIIPWILAISPFLFLVLIISIPFIYIYRMLSQIKIKRKGVFCPKFR